MGIGDSVVEKAPDSSRVAAPKIRDAIAPNPIRNSQCVILPAIANGHWRIRVAKLCGVKASVICTASLLLIVVLPQSLTQKTATAEKPELALSVILGVENYSLRENVSPKARFTNVSNATLCFPEPPLEYVSADSGVLATTLRAPEGHDNSQFLEVFDGAGPRSREELLQQVKKRWVWLRPSESYTTKSVPLKTTLDVPGQWRIEMSYRPPEGSFRPAKYRKYLSSVAKSAGCTLPQVEIAAEPIGFSVSQ